MAKNLEVRFYRAPEPIIKIAGIVPAVIYGFISSKESLEKGYCYMSYPNMAKELHLSESTLQRHMEKLVKSGLIVDISGRPSRNSGETKHLKTNPDALEQLESYLKSNEVVSK